MRAGAWKISTFTALGLAGFLALHPLAAPDSKVGPNGAKTSQKSGGILSWLSGGGYSSVDESLGIFEIVDKFHREAVTKAE